MIKRAVIIFSLLAAVMRSDAAQSAWVHFGAGSSLVYSNDSPGNRLPDFSFAGYEGGGVAIPTNEPVKQTLNPVAGDNTTQIQNAINGVSALTPDVNGVRGVVLLNPGVYTIGGSLTISAGGVVLRGSGNNTNTGTVLLVTNTARTVLNISGSGSWSQVGGTYNITDNYVPLGATNFHVSSGAIVWGTNVTVSGDADVFTNGVFQYAYNWTGTNATVNGVTFTGTTSANPGNVSLAGIGSNYRGYSSGSTPFSNLSVAYRSVLIGGEYNSGADTATVTLNNLTAGETYAVQVWVSDPRGGGTIGRTEAFSSANSVTLAYNVPPATGGIGQYSIGAFTATSASQTFSITVTNAAGSTQLNALLVSDVTATGYQPTNPPPAVSPFIVGESIVVQRPWTQSWITAIGMNLLAGPWTPGSGLQLERTVTAVNGNQITIDDPLVNPIESVWVTGQVYQVTDTARIQQDGVENLCAIGQIADYPSNILTGDFANFTDLKNCWAQNILLSGWGNGITFGGGTKWCTAQDCIYTNPATGTSSAAPAAWTIAGANCLFQRCVSDGGYYHIMVTQASTPGPDVFLNLNCTGTHYNGGPHQRWAAGALHDNVIMAADSQGGSTPYLAINNRGNDGSGQGWAAGFSVAYNCQVPQFQIEQPATTTNQYNWAIGGIGSKDNYSDIGIYDAFGGIVSPHSLYLEQLKERLGGTAVENIGYTLFTISNSPPSQTVNAGAATTFTLSIGDPALMSNVVTVSVSGLPSGARTSFSTNAVTGAGYTTLTIAASNGIPQGTYALTFTGTSAGLAHTSTASLTVLNTSRIPVAGSLLVNGNTLIISGTNGTYGGSYYVLASTNLNLSPNLWPRVATNFFDGAGNFVFTNSLSTNSFQNFFRLQLP